MSEASYQERETLTFREAAYRTFRIMGINVIEDAPKFSSCVLDLIADDTPATRVVERNCDADFLDCYKPVLVRQSDYALDDAWRRAAAYLEQSRMLQHDISQQTAAEMGFALGLYLGIPCSENLRMTATNGVAPESEEPKEPIEKVPDPTPPALIEPDDEDDEDAYALDQARKTHHFYSVLARMLCVINAIICFANASTTVGVVEENVQQQFIMHVYGAGFSTLALLFLAVFCGILFTEGRSILMAQLTLVGAVLFLCIPWAVYLMWFITHMADDIVPLFSVFPNSGMKASFMPYTLYGIVSIFLLMAHTNACANARSLS